MQDGNRADQSDRGPRFRRPRWSRAWWRPGGVRRTFRDHGPAAGAGQFDLHLMNILGDTERWACQQVLPASLGDAMVDLSGCMLPAWPWGLTGRRKDSRAPHPTGLPGPGRRRLPRSSGPGRGRAHAGRPGRPGGSPANTLSGASDTSYCQMLVTGAGSAGSGLSVRVDLDSVGELHSKDKFG
jgi:hypothetical protein